MSTLEGQHSCIPSATAEGARLKGARKGALYSVVDQKFTFERQARDAKEELSQDLRPVRPLLDDYRRALGRHAFKFG
jgi:hypothetical protein